MNSKEDIDKAVAIAVTQAEKRKDVEFMAERDEFIKHIRNMFKILEHIAATVKDIKMPDLKKRAVKTKEYKEILFKKPADEIKIHFTPTVHSKEVESMVDSTDDKPLKGGALRMMKILVGRYPMQFSKAQLATFSKMKASGGSYSTYLSTLRSKGYIQENGGLIQASEAALDEIGVESSPPQTTEEVIQMWRENLKGGARRMFDILIEEHPSTVLKERLGEMSGISPSGGSFSTYLSMLKSNGLIKVGAHEVKASDDLFI